MHRTEGSWFTSVLLLKQEKIEIFQLQIALESKLNVVETLPTAQKMRIDLLLHSHFDCKVRFYLVAPSAAGLGSQFFI